MTSYNYHNSLVERIEFRHARDATQASIFTTQNITPEQLADLRKKLGAASVPTMMDSVEGRAVIQVRGLKDEQVLFAALSKIDANIKNQQENETSAKAVGGFKERVRGKSLFLSALFYDLGNAALFVSGIQRGKHNADGKMSAHDKSELLTGAAFSVGDLLMTAYGDKKGDEQLESFSNNLKKHLHQKQIEVPMGDALNPDSLHQSGAYKATDRWLRKHIIQIKCATEMAGGLYMIHASMKPGDINRGKMLAGFLLSTGWLATLLMDKSHKPQLFHGKEEPEGLFEKIKANPRGYVARPLAMGNNVANLWGSLNPRTGEKKRFREEFLEAEKTFHASPTAQNEAQFAKAKARQNDYVWNVVTACSFLVAHTLFGMSGNRRPHETDDDKAMMDDLVLVSANMLAQQPEAIRKQAVDETADYISKLPHVGFSKEQIAGAISDKIDSLDRSSWAKRVEAGQAQEVKGLT